MNTPKIAIIIPCYLQSEYLDTCLDSIYKQKYDNWECIIINDGSPDKTGEIAQNWTLKDSRFKYYEKENGGLSSARNYGLQKTQAEYIQFLDCDDFIHPDKFEHFANELNTGSHDILLSNFQMYANNKYSPAFCELKEHHFSYNAILLQWDIDFSIPIHCAIFKKRFISAGGFNTELKAKEDWLFWIQFFENRPKVVWKDDVFNYYRLHQSSMTRDRLLMMENTKKINQFLVKYIKEDQLEDFMSATHERYMVLLKSMNDEILSLKKSFESPNFKKVSRVFKQYIKRRWRKITNSHSTA
ncbi:glycosyltransferase family 2 protein [Sphingobacterium tabacisoli]|uniref:Glycosyltransferase family 2 protein n=1 Tax=Sphingobacterium tabacisoli TaxID=2044855 RepID=A0ABW5KZV3_9SPHI|nr:glycosyltransferase family 2 protein [Sphingobacterium tabacisoli]